LATTGIIESIIIDTTGFKQNSPQNVFIQGCYSKDVDPHYDSFTSWVCLVPQSSVLPGGETTFYLNVKDPITHIRLHLIPDGGIQQIKVIGKPAKKESKQTLLIKQASEEDDLVEVMLQQEEEEIIATMLEQLNKSAVEQLDSVDL
jgi:allantoicase